MTNNLKAERTLTAEELQQVMSECDELTDATDFWGHNPSFIKVMASMALQSLSTQQPMGEVTDEMIARASKAMDDKFSESALDVWPNWDELALIGLRAALRPVQEVE